MLQSPQATSGRPPGTGAGCRRLPLVLQHLAEQQGHRSAPVQRSPERPDVETGRGARILTAVGYCRWHSGSFNQNHGLFSVFVPLEGPGVVGQLIIKPQAYEGQACGLDVSHSHCNT